MSGLFTAAYRIPCPLHAPLCARWHFAGWDLETNKCIRHYHGHMQGVYSMSLHPTLDVLVTGGRDRVARVWDMRTKAAIHVLSGHEKAIASITTNSVDPQIVTGSMDSTIRVSASCRIPLDSRSMTCDDACFRRRGT